MFTRAWTMVIGLLVLAGCAVRDSPIASPITDDSDAKVHSPPVKVDKE